MLTTTVRPNAVPQKTELSALNKLIMNPGGSMPLDQFCDKWLPLLYRGIEKHKKCSQEVTCFRTDKRLTLTWKQAWLREVEAWDIGSSAALHWGFEGKGAPYFVKRIAYIMDLVLEEKWEVLQREKRKGNRN
jgi:hypothetical protein